MLKIYKDTKVYVTCPPWAQTGGPEALHVLAYELRNLGVDACIYYGDECANPVAPAYERFNLPYVFEVEEKPHNIIVAPEIWGNHLTERPNMQRAFFWLSVDNHFGTPYVDLNDDTIVHFAQSYYALDYLKQKGAKNICFVSDYTNEFYVNASPEDFGRRSNIILYNPAKGITYTEKIMENAPHLNFVPIKDLNEEGIRELCLKSKIYIDFGTHPGKDRLPRETAILGNIVVTNKQGSARFYEDIPIKDEYKFENVEESIPTITKKLEYWLKNYHKCIGDFTEYRRVIKGEKAKFINDIKNAFNIN